MYLPHWHSTAEIQTIVLIWSNDGMKNYREYQVQQPANNHPPKDHTDNVKSFKSTIKQSDYPEYRLDSKNNKVPLNTYGNLEYMLNQLNIILRWNDMRRSREVLIPGFPLFRDDEENSALREITNLAEINGFPTSKIDDHLESIAIQHRYHPIVDCIKAKPWDGKSRVDDFISTIKSTNDSLSRILIRRWMISAIAAIFSDESISLQGVLVLQGKQNVGKTSWIKSLDPISCGAIREGAILDPANKDDVISVSRYWIVELGELDGTFRKSDIARLKAFITNPVDIVRAAYARKHSQLTRRTAFVATVNEPRFLVDDTGNRRWWTIPVESINLNHGLDIQQIWAEIYQLWLNGEQQSLTIDELTFLNKANTDYEQIDPLEEKVIEHFNWRDNWQNYQTLSMTSSNVLHEIGYKTPTRTEATRMGKILTKLTGSKPHRRYHILPVRKIR